MTQSQCHWGQVVDSSPLAPSHLQNETETKMMIGNVNNGVENWGKTLMEWHFLWLSHKGKRFRIKSETEMMIKRVFTGAERNRCKTLSECAFNSLWLSHSSGSRKSKTTEQNRVKGSGSKSETELMIRNVFTGAERNRCRTLSECYFNFCDWVIMANCSGSRKSATEMIIGNVFYRAEQIWNFFRM